MQCPRCAYDIPAHAKFCSQCGIRLVSTCAHCKTELPLDASFCPECRNPATAPGPGQDSLPTPGATPRDLRERIRTSVGAIKNERKQVSVLFADLAGSTELVAERDPEDARMLLGSVVERMMEAVYLYEGTVNHVIGDGIMAIFGAPLAQEDHAFRACCAALAMQKAVRTLSAERQRSHGVPVLIRVGINSGEVVVGQVGTDFHTEYSAIGHTTNLAARMEQLAPPGGIYLTHSTHRLVEEFARVRDAGPVRVKGVREPVGVFDLVGLRSTRRTLSQSSNTGLSRFVGRQRELETLELALEEAAAGRGRMVALVGEAGVGKSRLVFEFRRCEQLQRWLLLESGYVSQGRVTSYQPIIGLLKRYFEIDDGDNEEQMRQKIERQLARLEGLHASLPAFLALLNLPVTDPQWQALDPRQRRDRTLGAIEQLLLRESGVQPVCLIFEDLHRIDAETQTILDSVVKSLRVKRLLIIVNYRPEYEHGWASGVALTQLRIEPLSSQDTETLLHAMIGEDPQLSPLVDFLIERTDGNPLFLEESVQELLGTGILAGQRGAYRVAKPVESVRVPPTVEAILAARIDRLPLEDKHVLQTAAVLDKDFPFAVLKTIVGGTDADLRASLGRLQAMEFLYETRTSPETHYTFKHTLTHEVAYRSVLNERRKELDTAIVEAIESQYSNALLERTESLAHHAFRGEWWDKALPYLQRAGTRAFARSAYGEAKAHFENALTALSHLPVNAGNLKQAIHIRVELGPVLIATKGTGAAEVESLYLEARELCERIGETAQLFPVLWGLARLHVRRGDLESGQQVGQQLLSVAQRVRDPALLLEAHHTLWATLFSLGELDSTRSHLEQGFHLYDPQQHGHHAGLYGGHDPGVCCHSHAARVLWLQGYPDQAAQHAEQAVISARELSHSYTMASALHNAIWTHQHRGDRGATHEQLDALWKLATEEGFPASIANATVVRGWLLAQDGHGREGIAVMRERWESLGRTRYHFAALLAEAYGEEGHPHEGLREVDRELATVVKTGERFYEPELHRIKGELLLRQAHPDEDGAARCFRESIRIAREQRSRSFELRATTSLSRLLQQQGKRDEARRELEGIYRWFAEGFGTQDLIRAKTVLEALS